MNINQIKPIKIITQEQLQAQAHTLALEICTRYKHELFKLINFEIENTESIETLNTLARLKQRATAAWLHTAA